MRTITVQNVLFGHSYSYLINISRIRAPEELSYQFKRSDFMIAFWFEGKTIIKTQRVIVTVTVPKNELHSPHMITRAHYKYLGNLT